LTLVDVLINSTNVLLVLRKAKSFFSLTIHKKALI
jgi:hypothetical protein